MREEDLGIGIVALELLDELGDAVLDEVVAQVHDEGVTGHELLGDLDGVREAKRGLLRDVGDRDAPALAIAERRHDLFSGIADDDADVGDAGSLDRLYRVEQDRLVGHRHELLGTGERYRAQTGAFAPCKNQGFHVCTSPRRTSWVAPREGILADGQL